MTEWLCSNNTLFIKTGSGGHSVLTPQGGTLVGWVRPDENALAVESGGTRVRMAGSQRPWAGEAPAPVPAPSPWAPGCREPTAHAQAPPQQQASSPCRGSLPSRREAAGLSSQLVQAITGHPQKQDVFSRSGVDRESRAL